MIQQFARSQKAFLLAGVKPEDTTELAESIQHLCETFRRVLVNAAHEAEIRIDRR